MAQLNGIDFALAKKSVINEIKNAPQIKQEINGSIHNLYPYLQENNQMSQTSLKQDVERVNVNYDIDMKCTIEYIKVEPGKNEYMNTSFVTANKDEKDNLLKNHNEQLKSKNFACKICNKTFSLSCYLKQHLTVHSDLRIFQCDYCCRAFKKRSHLKDHLVVHSDEKLHQCMLCQRSFKRRRELQTHLVTHSDKRQYQCLVCKKAFKRLVILKQHATTVHSEVRPFSCVVCNKGFKRKSDMHKHLRAHNI